MPNEGRPPNRDPQPPLRAVIYDVDGTMYRLRPMRLRMARQLVASFLVRPGRTWRDVLVLRAYRRSQERLRGRAVPAPRGGSGDPQLRAAADELGLPWESIQPIVEEWMHRRPLRVLKRCRRQAVLDAIRMLKEAHVAQAVYSDYPAEEKLAALGVADCFDAVVWSAQAEVGQYKPSPKGFCRAAERLGVPPAECVYVGDRPEVDGAGARAAGMRYLDVAELATPRSLTRLVACGEFERV